MAIWFLYNVVYILLLIINVSSPHSLSIIKNLKLNKNNAAATNDFIRSVIRAQDDLLWIQDNAKTLNNIRSKKDPSHLISQKEKTAKEETDENDVLLHLDDKQDIYLDYYDKNPPFDESDYTNKNEVEKNNEERKKRSAKLDNIAISTHGRTGEINRGIKYNKKIRSPAQIYALKCKEKNLNLQKIEHDLKEQAQEENPCPKQNDLLGLKKVIEEEKEEVRKNKKTSKTDGLNNENDKSKFEKEGQKRMKRLLEQLIRLHKLKRQIMVPSYKSNLIHSRMISTTKTSSPIIGLLPKSNLIPHISIYSGRIVPGKEQYQNGLTSRNIIQDLTLSPVNLAFAPYIFPNTIAKGQILNTIPEVNWIPVTSGPIQSFTTASNPITSPTTPSSNVKIILLARPAPEISTISTEYKKETNSIDPLLQSENPLLFLLSSLLDLNTYKKSKRFLFSTTTPASPSQKNALIIFQDLPKKLIEQQKNQQQNNDARKLPAIKKIEPYPTFSDPVLHEANSPIQLPTTHMTSIPSITKNGEVVNGNLPNQNDLDVPHLYNPIQKGKVPILVGQSPMDNKIPDKTPLQSSEEYKSNDINFPGEFNNNQKEMPKIIVVQPVKTKDNLMTDGSVEKAQKEAQKLMDVDSEFHERNEPEDYTENEDAYPENIQNLPNSLKNTDPNEDYYENEYVMYPSKKENGRMEYDYMYPEYPERYSRLNPYDDAYRNIEYNNKLYNFKRKPILKKSLNNKKYKPELKFKYQKERNKRANVYTDNKFEKYNFKKRKLMSISEEETNEVFNDNKELLRDILYRSIGKNIQISFPSNQNKKVISMTDFKKEGLFETDKNKSVLSHKNKNFTLQKDFESIIENKQNKTIEEVKTILKDENRDNVSKNDSSKISNSFINITNINNLKDFIYGSNNKNYETINNITRNINKSNKKQNQNIEIAKNFAYKFNDSNKILSEKMNSSNYSSSKSINKPALELKNMTIKKDLNATQNKFNIGKLSETKSSDSIFTYNLNSEYLEINNKTDHLKNIQNEFKYMKNLDKHMGEAKESTPDISKMENKSSNTYLKSRHNKNINKNMHNLDKIAILLKNIDPLKVDHPWNPVKRLKRIRRTADFNDFDDVIKSKYVSGLDYENGNSLEYHENHVRKRNLKRIFKIGDEKDYIEDYQKNENNGEIPKSQKHGLRKFESKKKFRKERKHIGNCLNGDCDENEACPNGDCSSIDLCPAGICSGNEACPNGICGDNELCPNGNCAAINLCPDGNCADSEVCPNGVCSNNQACPNGNCAGNNQCPGGNCAGNEACPNSDCGNKKDCLGGNCDNINDCPGGNCGNDLCPGGDCAGKKDCPDGKCRSNENCLGDNCNNIDICPSGNCANEKDYLDSNSVGKNACQGSNCECQGGKCTKKGPITDPLDKKDYSAEYNKNLGQLSKYSVNEQNFQELPAEVEDTAKEKIKSYYEDAVPETIDQESKKDTYFGIKKTTTDNNINTHTTECSSLNNENCGKNKLLEKPSVAYETKESNNKLKPFKTNDNNENKNQKLIENNNHGNNYGSSILSEKVGILKKNNIDREINNIRPNKKMSNGKEKNSFSNDLFSKFQNMFQPEDFNEKEDELQQNKASKSRYGKKKSKLHDFEDKISRKLKLDKNYCKDCIQPEDFKIKMAPRINTFKSNRIFIPKRTIYPSDSDIIWRKFYYKNGFYSYPLPIRELNSRKTKRRYNFDGKTRYKRSHKHRWPNTKRKIKWGRPIRNKFIRRLKKRHTADDFGKSNKLVVNKSFKRRLAELRKELDKRFLKKSESHFKVNSINKTANPLNKLKEISKKKEIYDKELEKAKGSLTSNIVDKVFKEVQNSNNLKHVIGPGLNKNHHPPVNKEKLEQFSHHSKEENLKKTEEMLHQIMLAINNIIYEEVTSHTCQKLEPNIAEYLRWLTESYNSNTESVAASAPKNDENDLNFRQDTYLFGAPLSGTKLKKQELHKKRLLIENLLRKYNRLRSKDKEKYEEVKRFLHENKLTVQKLSAQVKSHDNVKSNKEKRKQNIQGSVKYKKLVKRAQELKEDDEKKRNLKGEDRSNFDGPLTFHFT